MATFVGVRIDGAVHVYRLDPPDCTRLKHHLVAGYRTKGGFEWGYRGAGPAELAIAILHDVCQDDDVAARLYQRFKHDVIAFLPRAGFVMESEYVERWLMEQIASDPRIRVLFDEDGRIG